MIAASRTASIVLVPVTSFAGYATYVRSTSQPTQAHANFMKASGVNQADHLRWRKLNNGLGLVDVGRSCGGL
ncbi:uncharacterized protein B0P05DRAFT_543079 [Gilbertella persicaria]|uniref:Uncharacterized protein n=1 Tax=Rhizopus stolonifer TaxID=4846 RepID=A0A367KT26_RHIST|nr:uncharacterized protein B0P05DRAFT_543079 [Gilbertella persicaria]KAI8078244.1 hypothetical protein B0P05DRAFT_543079 [Gilbertella persicaria]RCI05364.1 hypothetical protein CU098_005889 [Rhizopus stolonifer]